MRTAPPTIRQGSVAFGLEQLFDMYLCPHVLMFAARTILRATRLMARVQLTRCARCSSTAAMWHRLRTRRVRPTFHS